MFLERCTPDQLKGIYAEFGVTEESLKRDAACLMDWLDKQPHLPKVEDEEMIINLFLRCKTSMEKAKKQLDDLYTGKAILAKALPPRDIDAKLAIVKHVLLNCGFYIPIPKLTPEGYRLLVLHFHKDIPKAPSTDDLLLVLQISLLALWKLDTHKSMIVIYDVRNLSMSLVSTLAAVIPKLIDMVYKTMRFRFIRFHIVGMSPMYEHLLFLFKTLMPAKEVAKIKFWKKKPEDLVEVLPKDILPVDYGGNEKSVVEYTELWYYEIEKLKDWLSTEENMIADLQKRPKDCQQNRDVLGAYGVDGTFKKLAVD